MKKSPEGSSRPTIRDVAALAGVSKSLVSLAFQDGSRVSPERRDRIMDAAQRLGYRPNLLARYLAAEGSPFVGILVADLKNPVLTDIAESVRSALHRQGHYGLVAGATDVVDRYRGEDYGTIDERILDMFRDLRPRGLVIVGTAVDEKSLPPGMPVVCASSAVDDGATTPTVRVDDDAGIRLAVDHLRGLGHRRIGFIGGAGGAVARDRWAAYLRCMDESGGEARVEQAGFTEAEGREAATRLLGVRDRPTAVVAMSDLVALGALSAADALGLDVPGDVALTGFDNTSIAAMRRIGLTSVDPMNDHIGRRAAAMVAAMMEQPGHRPADATVAPALAVRHSTQGSGRAS